MLYPKQTNCSENGNIDSLISSIDCRLSKLANTMYNNTVFMLNKTISGTEMFDLIQYKRILYYKQINPDYVDCYSVNQIASQVKRFTANCTGNCNGNGNDNNIFPAPPIRTTTTTSSTTCPPTTSTTSSTTTNTTTCKPSGLTFFTLTTGIVYNSVTYNFSEMSLIDICNLLVNICYPYTGEFTYTTVFGETTAIEIDNNIYDPLSGPCASLPDGIYLNGEPGDSCGTVASIFEVVDGVITETFTTCNVVTTTTTSSSSTTSSSTTTTTTTIPCVNCVEASVTIGDQVWDKCNLNVETYSDLTPIPEVTDPVVWSALTTGAWCHYNNDPANEAVYGKLYNWYAAAGIYDAASLANPLLRKNLAPTGSHVPTDEEWTTLTTFLGGESVAGGKMKEIQLCHWVVPNLATNESGFTAFGAGYRQEVIGTFVNLGLNGVFWSLSENISATDRAWYRLLIYTATTASRASTFKVGGFSIRCLRD